MEIETLRITDSECEGYAIRINGRIEFEYFTQYDAREDAYLDRDHKDILELGEVIRDAYWTGVLTDGRGHVTLEQRETKNRDEYFEFTLKNNE